MSERVTREDRDAAADFLESWEPGPEMTVVKLARVFARHRELGRRQGVEEAAKVAEQRAREHEAAFAKALEVRHTDHQTHYAARYREAGEIATAIRKLGSDQ